MGEDLTEHSPGSRAKRHGHLTDSHRISGYQLGYETLSIRLRDVIGREVN